MINPKLGDKVLSSSTDTKLVEFKTQMDTSTNASENGGEKKKSSEQDEEEDMTEPSSEKNKSSLCEWKFFAEKDDEFKAGFRIQLTLHKVKQNKTNQL